MRSTKLQAIIASLLVGAGLMAVKFYAYHLTGSSAVLSDALESIINVVASAFAVFSIVVAALPADDSHPYGHGKIEYFSAGFEGALIVLAAFGIFRSGLPRLLHPQPLPNLDIGMLVLVGASAVNLLLGLALIRIGKRSDSLTLIADGKHVLTDVYTSAGVLVGLGVVRLTGWLWVDGLAACLVGLNILVTGYRLIRQSLAGLMDESDPDLMQRISKLIIENRRDPWIDIHQLRTWKSGSNIHMDLHLVLPRYISLEDAHREAKHLESILLAPFNDNASALIHMDPCEDPDCPACRKYLCGIRKNGDAQGTSWNLDTLTTQKRGFSSKKGKEP